MLAPILLVAFSGKRSELNYDKSGIYLPRQVTKIVLKTFENQGFFQNTT